MHQKPQSLETDAVLWERGVTLLTAEFSRLPEARRAELTSLLAEVGRLKREIVALTDGAEGDALCSACRGACCRVGRYHPTPLDLLAAIAAGELPVPPDPASGGCPFLGEAGCRIAPSRRPRCCVIFICEPIEARLALCHRDRLAGMEARLNLLCKEAAARFGRRLTASLLLEMERSDRDGVPFLAPPPPGG